MAKTAQVSVVVPCYNQGEYLEEAIGSVLNQTYKNVEVIVVDDGSTEKSTLRTLERISEKGISVIRQDNMSLPVARNSGVAVAKGKYVLCLDADDVLEPDYLQKTVRLLDSDKEERVGFVASWIKTFGLTEEVWVAHETGPETLLLKNVASVGGLFRKEAWKKVGGYNEEMKNGGYEDWDFWIKLVEARYTWKVVPEPLFRYRVKEHSMVTESFRNHDSLYKTLITNHREMYLKLLPDIIVAQRDLSNAELADLRKGIEIRDKEIRELQRLNATIMNSKGWKLLEMFRKTMKKLTESGKDE